MKKLNLGCGSIRPKGWINIDSSLNANIQRIPVIGKIITKLFNPIEYENSNIIYMNLNNKWHFANDSIDIVYSSHLFEHLNIYSAEIMLKEAYRTLKPGGIIRIVVPDLYKICKKYMEDYTNRAIEDPTEFIMWAINMHREGQYGKLGFFKSHVLEIFGYPHQHKFMYDERSLSLRLTKTGFVDLLLHDYGTSDYIERIDNLEGTKEAYLSVYLEAKKPM